MKHQLIVLDALRCPDGYEIRGGRLYARSHATESAALGAEVYREFSELEPDAISAFAARYGALVTAPTELAERGEPVAEWLYSISDMQVTIAHLAGDEKDQARDTINAELTAPMTLEQLRYWKDDDPLPTLTYTLPHAAISDGHLHMCIQAPNLKSYLWLQLLDAAAEMRWRRCRAPGCGRWMPIGPSGFRTNRLTHTDACRVRWDAHLRGMAARLYAQHLSYATIVQRLKAEGWRPGKTGGRTPVQQIKQWISKEQNR